MKGSPQKTELHVNELIREVLNFLRTDIDENRIILNFDLGPELPPVFGDRIQLQQAFMNIVVNSTEALRLVPEPHRKPTIRSRSSAEGLLIEVMDSGPGLDSHAAERLFEPFFTTKPEGMGLGLSISRSIIESHGGRLSNISKSCGQPLRSSSPQHRRSLMSEPAPTVFVIDDDPSIRRAIKRLVESVGLRVEALGSAKEFLGTEVPDGLRWRFSSMSLKGHLRSVAGTVFGRSVYLLR